MNEFIIQAFAACLSVFIIQCFIANISLVMIYRCGVMWYLFFCLQVSGGVDKLSTKWVHERVGRTDSIMFYVL
jgi:hypothetical protein